MDGHHRLTVAVFILPHLLDAVVCVCVGADLLPAPGLISSPLLSSRLPLKLLKSGELRLRELPADLVGVEEERGEGALPAGAVPAVCHLLCVGDKRGVIADGAEAPLLKDEFFDAVKGLAINVTLDLSIHHAPSFLHAATLQAS